MPIFTFDFYVFILPFPCPVICLPCDASLDGNIRYWLNGNIVNFFCITGLCV